jgi:hypothetical protein
MMIIVYQEIASSLTLLAKTERGYVIASRRRGDLWDCFVANAPRKDGGGANLLATTERGYMSLRAKRGSLRLLHFVRNDEGAIIISI